MLISILNCTPHVNFYVNTPWVYTHIRMILAIFLAQFWSLYGTLDAWICFLGPIYFLRKQKATFFFFFFFFLNSFLSPLFTFDQSIAWFDNDWPVHSHTYLMGPQTNSQLKDPESVIRLRHCEPDFTFGPNRLAWSPQLVWLKKPPRISDCCNLYSTNYKDIFFCWLKVHSLSHVLIALSFLWKICSNFFLENIFFKLGGAQYHESRRYCSRSSKLIQNEIFFSSKSMWAFPYILMMQ